MKHLLRFLVLVILPVAFAQSAQPFVWLEGEKPATSNFAWKAMGGPTLSDGLWLGYIENAKSVNGKAIKEVRDIENPPEVTYTFEAAEAGDYELWLRVGYDFLRPTLQWRVDSGEWQTLDATVHTTSLMSLYMWCEAGWAKGGQVPLTAGKHVLAIRWTKTGADGRVLIGLDAIAFVKGTGWTPEGWLKPGEQYNQAIDQEAATNVFRFPTDVPAQAPGEPVGLSLDGVWQVARFDDPNIEQNTYEPVKALPKDEEYELRWRGVKVPGNALERPDMVFGHRAIFQARIDVPATAKDRSFRLHLAGIAWIASVFVNGTYVGASKTALDPWEMDITAAVKPGTVNTIALAVKDGYYAIDIAPAHRGGRKSLEITRCAPLETFENGMSVLAPVYPGVTGMQQGIHQSVKLVIGGLAHTSDVFVRTRIAPKQLDATVTVANSGTESAALQVLSEVLEDKSGAVAKRFDPVAVTVPAGGTQEVAVGGPWADAKLWWPAESPDDLPTCYILRTTLLKSGIPIDVHKQLFGFREIAIHGTDYVLNGIPWHFWEWGRWSKDTFHTPQQWLGFYHSMHERNSRRGGGNIHFDAFTNAEQELEFYDRQGIPVRWCGTIGGLFATFDLNKDVVWTNFADNVRAVVRLARSHPSVLDYSLENELLFVNSSMSFNGFKGPAPKHEDHFFDLCRLAKELDPTRSVFGDGAGDLHGRCDVCSQHYAWPSGGMFPTEMYAFRTKHADEDYDAFHKRVGSPWAWDGLRPLSSSEESFYSGNLSAYAWIGGPAVYRGRSFAEKACGLYDQIAMQGCRWQGVGEMYICSPVMPGGEISFFPRAVFVREWNAVFFPGTEMKRTIKVFNDGRNPAPLTLAWKLVLDGKNVANGKKTYQVPCGRDQQDVLTIALPKADRRTEGELRLDLSAEGQVVFTDAKPVTLLPRSGAVDLNADTLAVFDPEGSVRKWLDERRMKYTALNQLGDVPATARAILIGKDALTVAIKTNTSARLAELVTGGATVIVVEQQAPLEGAELTIGGIAMAGEQKNKAPRAEFRAAGGQIGRICFPTAPAHPVLKDLTSRDFFTWAGDEVNFRASYATPSSGPICVMQAGNELGLAPLLDVRQGTGSYLLCQLLIATKLDIEPTADRLLYNALAWAAARASAKPGRTAVFAAGDKPLQEALAMTGLKCEYSDAPISSAAFDSGASVLIAEASPDAMAELAKNATKLKAFCKNGGWVMLCNLDERGLASFDKLTGITHQMRPFVREAVVLKESTDPLLLGLTDRDVGMSSSEVLSPWKNLCWTSKNVFTCVVDASDDDVIGFVHFAKSADYYAKVVDGLSNDDFWQYVAYLQDDGSQTIDMDFSQPETFTSFRIWSSMTYHAIKDMELVFDGTDVVPLTLAKTKEMQEFPIQPPRKSKTVTLRLKSVYPGESAQSLVEVGEIKLLRQVPADVYAKAVVLAHPGGLVKYPIGKGGMVLNQLDLASKDTPANLSKKQGIFANLLRNMGAAFETGERK